MKKILLIFVIAFIFFLTPSIAEAHFPQDDGNFHGLLHVEPGDKATAQQHVTLMFTLNDKTHKFQINNCNCEVTIAVPGKLPYTQRITTPAAATGGLYSVMVPFVFPRGGVYNISFIGNPTSLNAFQAFNLTWHFRVTPATNEIQTLKTPKNPIQTKMILTILVVLVVLVAVGIFFFKKKIHKQKSTK